MQGQAGVDL
jgi:hypothetical protein